MPPLIFLLSAQPAFYNSWKYCYGGKSLENKKMPLQKYFDFILYWIESVSRTEMTYIFSLFSFLSYWRQKIYSLYLLYGGKSQEELWLKNLIGCWLGQEPPSKKWGDILADFSIWVSGWLVCAGVKQKD